MLIYQILSVVLILFFFSQQHLKKNVTALENLTALNRFRVHITTPVGVGHAVCLVYCISKNDNETTSMHTLTCTFHAQIEIGLVCFIYQAIDIVQGGICACVISASGCAACLCVQRCVMMTSSSPGRHCGGYFDSLLCYCCCNCPQIRACLLQA